MSQLIDKETLLQILERLDKEVSKKARLIAIGGTALTLMDLKQGSYDVDLMLENNDDLLKADITVIIYNAGYETQVQDKGVIIIHPLPSGYLRRYIKDKELNSRFQNIELYIMDPIDVIVTKIHRYNEKDQQDLARVILTIKPNFKDIERRFNEFIRIYKGTKAEILLNFDLFRKQYETLLGHL